MSSGRLFLLLVTNALGELADVGRQNLGASDGCNYSEAFLDAVAKKMAANEVHTY